MAERQDDLSIGKAERLWRRVHPTQVDWTVDPPEVSTAAFNTTDGMSVSIASETTIEKISTLYPEDTVVEFPAALARELGCTLERCPTAEDPAHAEVWGPRPRGRLNKTQVKGLRDAAMVVLSKRPPQT